jgi:pyruvate/2-oxoglutarate dehydrogenase complex dihydrolipoamide dehydrogenase (E3) component
MTAPDYDVIVIGLIPGAGYNRCDPRSAARAENRPVIEKRDRLKGLRPNVGCIL